MNNLNNPNNTMLPYVPDVNAIAKYNDKALKHMFRGKIKGNFLINVKIQVMKNLGFENFMRYYDFRWSDARMITGIGEAAEYDICRMIVGIHKAYSIFLSDGEIRKNETDQKYQQKVVAETIEKIKLRFYGSVYFRKNLLFQGEEFLYYSLPYELFAISVKMGEVWNKGEKSNCCWLYYGIICNGSSALLLMEDNFLGSAYPLCRGAIEMYLKLLALNTRTEYYNWFERFRMFEIEHSCTMTYSQEFNDLFEKRTCKSTKNKVDYLHFGFVDFIDGYHNIVKKFPYSVSGIILFLKSREKERIFELEQLERLYKSCHAYAHGSIQTTKYPIIHYFDISIMLYYIFRGAFLLLCKEKKIATMIDENDILFMIDRDFKILYKQYEKCSTENIEKYYNLRLSQIEKA